MKAIIALALFIAAATVAADPTDQPVGPIEAALAHPARPAADRERDPGRKPGQVLNFFGIEPGMRVLDLFSGDGYYAEILSRVVGSGSVVAHSNEAYVKFLGAETVARRYGDQRLANVETMVREANDLDLAAGTFDAVLMILTYHDIYYAPDDGNWPTIDGPKLLAALHRALKPGGVIGIVDHRAAPGTPREAANTLHRIDPAIVIAEMRAAGFELDASADFLANPDDDHGQPMFAEGIRGKTDRFVLRFRKR